MNWTHVASDGVYVAMHHAAIAVIVLCWLAFVAIWGGLLTYMKVRSPRRTSRSTFNFYGGLYVTGGLSLFCYLVGVGPILRCFVGQETAGATMCVVGLLVASYARVRLDGEWSLHATVREQPRLITRFPYSIVRHPIYTGQLVMCLGTAVASENVIVLLVFFVGTLVHHYIRALVEERFLNTMSDGRYEELFGTKGRFLPRIGAVLAPAGDLWNKTYCRVRSKIIELHLVRR